jgi:hypothetical protein
MLRNVVTTSINTRRFGISSNAHRDGCCRQSAGNTREIKVQFSTLRSGGQLRFWAAVLLLLFAVACNNTPAGSEPKRITEVTELAGRSFPAPAQSPAVMCERRFIALGMVLSRTAMDTKTGQQCRTAQNAPPAFRSLPMCLDLFSNDDIRSSDTPIPATSQSATAPCEQRFVAIGRALTRAAMDTKTGQQCRTVENAPPAFMSLPTCSDLLRRFPDKAESFDSNLTPISPPSSNALDARLSLLCNLFENMQRAEVEVYCCFRFATFRAELDALFGVADKYFL